MKIAIHDGEGWNKVWIDYARKRNIEFKLVDGYSPDIMTSLADVDCFMWHFDHAKPADILMARNVLFSAQKIGIRVFPDIDTSWHFDDKLSQKYLLEAIGAPVVKSWAFYNLDSAMEWVSKYQAYPLVAKLRRGAGSYNVKLIKTKSEAKSYVDLMFSKGVVPVPGLLSDIRNKIRVAGDIKGVIKRAKKVPGYFKAIMVGKNNFPPEKSYVYFQEFLPNNDSDLRVVVVSEKAWAFKRMVRKGDFRASGSGMINYDVKDIGDEVIRDSFETAKKLGTQSIAFDYVKGADNRYYIVEMSLGYEGGAVFACPEHWDESLIKISGHVQPEHFIFDEFIEGRI